MSIFHRHKWVHVSSGIVQMVDKSNRVVRTYTDLLWRCRCGEMKTTRLDGSWDFTPVGRVK